MLDKDACGSAKERLRWDFMEDRTCPHCKTPIPVAEGARASKPVALIAAGRWKQKPPRLLNRLSLK